MTTHARRSYFLCARAYCRAPGSGTPASVDESTPARHRRVDDDDARDARDVDASVVRTMAAPDRPFVTREGPRAPTSPRSSRTRLGKQCAPRVPHRSIDDVILRVDVTQPHADARRRQTSPHDVDDDLDRDARADRGKTQCDDEDDEDACRARCDDDDANRYVMSDED